jgi:uncharacterized membrane protein YeaQ/YmgE (transglycosylase-associated protein family)
MQTYIINAVLGAVIGYVGNYLPMVKNHQSSITNAVLGLVGGVGAGAGATAAGFTSPDNMLGSIGTGAVGSVVGLLAGKLFGNKTA